MNTNALKATGLALALLLAPAASKAVEVLKTEDVSIDIGARMQLVGTFNNWTATDSTTGKGNRDQTQIYLFQQENRLKLGADLMGVKFHFESSFGNDSYANAKTGVTVDTTINTTTAKAPPSWKSRWPASTGCRACCRSARGAGGCGATRTTGSRSRNTSPS